MEQYYPAEKQSKYGVLGIELCDVQAICDVKKEKIDVRKSRFERIIGKII